MAELQTENFEVGTAGELADHWLKEGGKEYGWLVGHAGELTVFLVEKHETFGATLRDERHFCYAPGTWEYVAVITDE